MGRKRARAGKYIYLCTACLIFFSLVSCNALKESKKEGIKQEEMRLEAISKQLTLAKKLEAISKQLTLAKKLFEQGNYEASLEENKNVLSLSNDRPPGDEALFNMGLIYAHYRNPQKDYKKSIFYFEKLLKEYPKSLLSEQAKIWIGVLQVIEKSKQVDIKIEEMKKELSK